MPDADPGLEAARNAKEKAKSILPAGASVRGIGLTRRGGRYAVQVNLASEPSEPLPDEIDGVPVVTKIVGEIRKRE